MDYPARKCGGVISTSTRPITSLHSYHTAVRFIVYTTFVILLAFYLRCWPSYSADLLNLRLVEEVGNRICEELKLPDSGPPYPEFEP